MTALDFLPIVLPVLAAGAVPLLALLATPAGVPVLGWLIGSAPGRIVAGIGIFLMVLWLFWRAGRADGVKRVKAEAAAKRLEDLAEKIAVEKELQALTPGERRERLRKWVK